MKRHFIRIATALLLSAVLTSSPAAAETYEAVGTTDCKAGFSPLFTGVLASGFTYNVTVDARSTLPAQIRFGDCKPETANAAAPSFTVKCAVCKRD